LMHLNGFSESQKPYGNRSICLPPHGSMTTSPESIVHFGAAVGSVVL
jgi:hypothetical protein